jgi:hypothetical protein
MATKKSNTKAAAKAPKATKAKKVTRTIKKPDVEGHGLEMGKPSQPAGKQPKPWGKPI